MRQAGAQDFETMKKAVADLREIPSQDEAGQKHAIGDHFPKRRVREQSRQHRRGIVKENGRWRLWYAASTASIDGTLGTCSTATACYVYDYGGRRVQRTLGGGTPVNYLYDLDGRVNSEIDLAQGSFDNSNHKLGWVASYIYLGGSLLAEYANSTTYFVHKDHLGSTRLLTDMTGCVVDNLDYLPYGELYSYTPSCSAPDIALKFTGKERDSESGLDNFGARYNSSQYGRFMSPDPSGIDLADWSDPQQLNLYAYVRNNPITLTDPYGLDCAYLNDSGNGIESSDTNSNSGECTSNGGYWVSGHVNQVSVNDNGSYNFGYSGVGPNGSIQSTTYNSYLSPSQNNGQPGYCTGGDVICGGGVPRAIGNIQSDNNANFIGASIAGIGLKVGAGLAAGLVNSGAEDATKVVFDQGLGHGARHLAGTGLAQDVVEKTITADVQKAVAGATASGNFWGRVVVSGQTVYYHAFTLASGVINVGTYTVGTP